MIKPEILAPAGSFESLIAAVRCGADAVYFGGKKLNARQNASNFTDTELNEAVRYCHLNGVKTHITMNTLLKDDEIPDAIDFLERICCIGADALILQDIGLFSLIKSMTKDISLHASTQCSVQSYFGFEFLEKIGFNRAVIPRECSLSEIKTISEKTSIELESFIHGALCMCVSGRCYLSSFIGSRSGNRGLCAQPCRLPFSSDNNIRYDLSLKDLSLINKIDTLSNNGVCSFKIEGRMKRPEYVAAAVTACKNSVNDIDNNNITDALHNIFSRSGFTDGYFYGDLSKDMFGIRTKEDVENSLNDLSFLKKLYEKEISHFPVSFEIKIAENKPIVLYASCIDESVKVVSSFIPELSIKKSLNDQSVKDNLSKCGGTVFYTDNIKVDLEDNLYVPISVINSLRRECIEKLSEKLSLKRKIIFNRNIPVLDNHVVKKTYIYARFDSYKQIPDNFEGISKIILPLQTPDEILIDLIQKYNIALELPGGIFGSADHIFELLKRKKSTGIKEVYCPNPDSFSMAKKLNLKAHLGFSMNVFNSFSLLFYENQNADEITVSPELTLKEISKLKGNIKRGIVAYGRLPLMLTRNCPIKNTKSCKECKRKSYLIDRFGYKFPVLCNNGFAEIYNSVPIYMADKIKDIKNVDFLTLYFATETKNEVSNIINLYKSKTDIKPESYTRGLYYRGVI